MPPARICWGRGFDFQRHDVGQELTKWPDQLDFSAELSKARAAKPDAIFVFYPGAPACNFSRNMRNPV
jgi:hypothetical protein